MKKTKSRNAALWFAALAALTLMGDGDAHAARRKVGKKWVKSAKTAPIKPITSKPSPAPAPPAPGFFETLSTQASSHFTRDLEIGTQFGRSFEGQKNSPALLYIVPKFSTQFEFGSTTPGVITLTSSLRASAAQYTGSHELLASPRELHIAYEQGHVKLQLGYQQVSWGETFGVQIADVVNPRDYSDPLITEVGWIKEPVAMANAQMFFSPVTLQFIATPLPRSGKSVTLPGLQGLAETRPGGIEWGGKANILFDFGLDLAAIYYNHWNRDVFLPAVEKIQTAGITASQSAGSFVFRADSVFSTHSRWQTILGSDLTTEDQWTLGAQAHHDRSGTQWTHAVSFKIAKKIAEGLLEPEIFLFQGLNRESTWVQTSVTWNLSDHLSALLRVDTLSGSDSPLSQLDRALLWMTYRF